MVSETILLKKGIADISIDYETDMSLSLIWTNKTVKPNVAYDISGYEFKFTVRKDKTPTSQLLFEILDGNMTKTASVPAGTIDKLSFTIANSVTGLSKGEYYYDVRMTEIATSKTQIVLEGKFILNNVVSQA